MYLSNEDTPTYSIEPEGEYLGNPTIFINTSISDIGPKMLIQFEVSVHSILEKLKPHFDNLVLGTFLKFCGGNPLTQTHSIYDLLKLIKEKWDFVPRIHIETYGTIAPLKRYSKNVVYTISPKLKDDRYRDELIYKPKIIENYVNNTTCSFKFYVRRKRDINEVIDRYVNKFDIAPKDVWLLPSVESEELHKLYFGDVVELAKEYNFNCSPRLEIITGDIQI